MPSSSGAEPTEQQANALVPGMDAKLMVATAGGDVQQLKDLVKKQEDSAIMVVVMAKQQAASEEKPRPQQGNMDPHLLALVSSGSFEELKSLLISREDGQQASFTNGGLGTNRASSYNGDRDTEANESILARVTTEGDTALHVVAASCAGCDQGDKFLEIARIIYRKARHLLFAQNKNGNTPLHCAVRSGKSDMVKCLIDLALTEGGEGRVKRLLRKENKNKETALHEAIRIGSNDIVDLLMDKDSELASFPTEEDGGGASPMYLAIVLEQDEIVDTLYDKASTSHGKLSFSGPNGQNALHAAVLRYQDEYLTTLLEWNETHLRRQNKDLTAQQDKNGSTPLHFAAAIELIFGLSGICRQVLEANPDALYQADNDAGFFPIHVAASVGAFRNVAMFVEMYPGSAGLRDAKGRTFLHVAVQKKMVSVVKNACRNVSLSWIMNMVDNDGNTALHLAVEAGSLRMFCHLFGNPRVKLNLPNSRGETPLDIAQYKIPEGLFNFQHSEVQICRALGNAGARMGVRRPDHLEDSKPARVRHDQSKEMEVLKDSTGSLCIGSVLIATVTFGATFAVPGGYNDGGSPMLARRYAFDAFIAANTLAFVFSAMAMVSLIMYSGSPLVQPRIRIRHFRAASYLVSISITGLAAAFALGAYVVLAPVAHKTAVATCVLASLVPLYTNVVFFGEQFLVLQPSRKRMGLIWTWLYSATLIVGFLLLWCWPLIFIFGWAAHANPGQ